MNARYAYRVRDSYTFGHGVTSRDTFANIMAAEHVPDVHVFRAGVSGYGVLQMYLRSLQIEERLGRAIWCSSPPWRRTSSAI